MIRAPTGRKLCHLTAPVMLALLAAGCGSSPDVAPSVVEHATWAGVVPAGKTFGGDIVLGESAIIMAGDTVILAPGTTLHAAPGATLHIAGTLLGPGEPGVPVCFQSAAHEGAAEWGGVEVVAGGTATLSYAEIHDATTAFAAQVGATYTLDHITLDSSQALALLLSDGTLSQASLHGLSDAQHISPVQITSSSPHLIDTLLDHGNPEVDLIDVLGADAAPAFDHVEVAQGHSGFYLEGGAQVLINNSAIHDNAEGVLVGSGQVKVQATNFQHNDVPIGGCDGGPVTVSGSYFDGPAFDASCDGQHNDAELPDPLSGVGPRP